MRIPYRKELADKDNILGLIGKLSREHLKIRSRDQLIADGCNCQWFSYLQLSERFKADKTMYDIKYYTRLWNGIYINDKDTIAKMCNF